MTVAGTLANFALSTRPADIPGQALDHAAMLVASTIASAASGSQLPSAGVMRRFLTARGGTPEATGWFTGGGRLPLAAAARLNALMSDAAASDDSDLRNMAHPGTTTVAAALAAAEQTGASGGEVATAVALGYEVAARINSGVIPGLMRENPWHGCMVAIFGGAVAAGLLLRLDQAQLAAAIGLSATSISGLLAAANTSMAREHHAGLAAGMGAEAAQLAALGLTVEPSVLEHPRGYFFAYGIDAHAAGRVACVTEGLGERWQMLESLAIKLAPGGHHHHAIAEAAAAAARDGDIAAGDIAAIVISCPNPSQVRGPRHPTDLIGVAHSPAYFAAAGAADRAFTWRHATAERIMDPAIRRLLDLVEIGPPPSDHRDRYRQGATVTLRTTGGRSVTRTVFAPRGAAAAGIDWADVDAKFRALAPAGGLDETAIAACLDSIHRLRDLPDMGGLVRHLAGRPAPG